MSDPKRSVLRGVGLFADLADEECDAVLRVMKARRGNPGDVLFAEGDVGSSLMLVLDGQLVARLKGEDVARLGPGEVVGEMAFLDAEPRSATVIAETVVTVLDFTRDALGALAREAPRVAAAILRNVLVDVARRLRDAGERLAGDSDGARDLASASAPSLRRPARGLTVEQLRAIPAFAAYGREDLELLAHVTSPRSFRRGETLVRAGEEGDACFLLASGSVDVYRPGGAAAIATLGAGALVGQLALLDRAPRSATVTASNDVVALELRGDAFANLVRASSPVALRFQWQVALAGAKQLRTATQRLATAGARTSYGGERTLDGWDDWDEGGESAISLELAIDPRARLLRSSSP